MLNEVIFLDRDGVINKWPYKPLEKDEDYYVTNWDQWEWCEGAIDAIALMSSSRYKLVVISNQSCIDRRIALSEEVYEIMARMEYELRKKIKTKQVFDGIAVCPHIPDAGCCCRKPKPGLIYLSAYHTDADLSKSWLIGDSDTDIEAGLAAEIPENQLIRILKEGETEEDIKQKFPNINCASNLYEAARIIFPSDEVEC